MKFDDLLREYFGPKPGWHAIYKKRPDAFKDPKCKRKIMKRFPFQPDPIKMEMQRDPKKTLFSMIAQDRIAADQGEWSGGTIKVPVTYGRSIMEQVDEYVPLSDKEKFKRIKGMSPGYAIASIVHGGGCPDLTWSVEDWGAEGELICIRDGHHNVFIKLPLDTYEGILELIRIAISTINRSDRDDGQ